jgi:hypothetical protein
MIILQRYSKIPALEEIEEVEGVGIAFDNMVVRPDNLHNISSMYPVLKRYFLINLLQSCTIWLIHIGGYSVFQTNSDLS